MYLAWANPGFLAFFAFNRINNLRIFSVAFSPIPTAPTNISSVNLAVTVNVAGQTEHSIFPSIAMHLIRDTRFLKLSELLELRPVTWLTLPKVTTGRDKDHSGTSAFHVEDS